jgi:methyl-accepting chemotaxis protein
MNKKLMATAITALLMLSMLSAAVPAFAIATPTLSATSGNVGDVITISGNTGAAQPGGQVKVYWENLAGPLLNETYALGSGAYEIKVTIPAAPAGEHSLIVQDAAGTTGAIFTIVPEITLSSTRGIPGDEVTVTGTGFGASKNVTISFNGVPTNWKISDASGSVSSSFTVPDLVYSTYAVSAADNATNTAVDVDFTIGASVTISPNSGPAGTVVTIEGKGFIHSDAGTLLTIAIGNVIPANLTTMRTNTDGTFSGTFVVPSSLAVQTARYMVSASDGIDNGTTSGPTGGFKVTGTTEIDVSPISAQPGTTVTITGSGFTSIAGTKVTVDFGLLSSVATITTDASGNFTGTFAVPNLPTGEYTIVAEDENGQIASFDFKIAITLVNLSPTSGPTGTKVTVTGYGFTPGANYNVTFASLLVAQGTVPIGTNPTVTAEFTIPTITATAYTVTVTDEDGLTASATFTVTATTEITVNPTQAPVGSIITLTAKYFSADAPITFVMKNSTASFSQTLTLNPSAVTNASGVYVGTFVLPNLALGTYTINGTDANGLNTTTTFTVGSATFLVSTRASEYRQGDIVSFKIQSSFAADLTITIVDPDGVPAVIPIAEDYFVQVGSMYVLAYSVSESQSYYGDQAATFTIPSDAPTGTWCWNTTEVSGIKVTGEFNVTKKISSEIDEINNKLNDINAKLVSISGNLVTIQSSQGTITTSINNLPSSLTSTIQASIESGMATISTSIGTITTSLDRIDAVLGAVAGDMVTVKTSVGDITTSLDNINAVVTNVKDGVATIKTDVGTIQGVVTQVKDGVATISTDIGTIQTSIAGLEEPVQNADNNTSNMSTMIYVAVAFAIIAAIAAVASILLMRKKIAS